jgi:hypothetical protein
MNFQKFSLKSTFRGAATSIFFLAALSGIAHGEVFLNTGFEDSSSLPDGWTQSTQTGTATWSIQSGGQNGGSNPSSAYSGANNATLYRANTSDNKTRLISPTFDTTGFINISLDFWHTQPLWFQDQD